MFEGVDIEGMVVNSKLIDRKTFIEAVIEIISKGLLNIKIRSKIS